ncbi:tryptophan synthase subunit alpha [Candidatus Annandia pinicola]|uniref:tryptophan synthase subunit alpha n=1 Tax=Candidatus Annandia pinicola TaxID=1345117 RepID=UPI001D011BB1|nr:tryptophan synthase subunit alpha [Candidatus Annandia pinicola]
MQRYQNLFKKLNLKKEIAFIPFVILGDPSFNISIKIIETLINNGADALELGIPFSDPLADGPTIQSSSLRSLKNNININKCFEIINIIRKKYKEIPIGILVYANIVFNKGIDNFYYNCSYEQIDSVLIADLPIEESKLFNKSAIKNNISTIFICPPNSNENLIKKISFNSINYVYLLSRSGVTGIEKQALKPINNLVTKLKKYNSAPVIQGFGISSIKHINNAIKSGIKGIIIGSFIINIIEKYYKKPNKMIINIKKAAKEFKKATIY